MRQSRKLFATGPEETKHGKYWGGHLMTTKCCRLAFITRLCVPTSPQRMALHDKTPHWRRKHVEQITELLSKSPGGLFLPAAAASFSSVAMLPLQRSPWRCWANARCGLVGPSSGLLVLLPDLAANAQSLPIAGSVA